MNSKTNYSGYLLALAGSTFWFSWFLMPCRGTTNVADSLDIVKHERNYIYFSSLIQMVSSVLYLMALFLLAHTYGAQRKITLPGIILFGIGVMGMCADAFFHLLAYYMTDDAVPLDNGIVRAMSSMQHDRMKIIMPLLLSFFTGSLLLTIGLNRQGITSKIPLFLNLTALVIVPISVFAARTNYLVESSMVSLSILGLLTTSHVFLGSEFIILIPDPDDLADNVAKPSSDARRQH